MWKHIDNIAETMPEPVYLRMVVLDDDDERKEGSDKPVLRCARTKDGEAYYRDVSWYSVPDHIEKLVRDGDSSFCALGGLTLKLTNGHRKFVVFQEAFLMNDEGKTIDRL